LPDTVSITSATAGALVPGRSTWMCSGLAVPHRSPVEVHDELDVTAGDRQAAAHPDAVGGSVEPQPGHPGGEEPARPHRLEDTLAVRVAAAWVVPGAAASINSPPAAPARIVRRLSPSAEPSGWGWYPLIAIFHRIRGKLWGTATCPASEHRPTRPGHGRDILQEA
jgi:hypothetical protein